MQVSLNPALNLYNRPVVNNNNCRKSFCEVTKPQTFGKALPKEMSLSDAIEYLHKVMSIPQTKKAEVAVSKKGLLFVELDNMTLSMQKKIVEGKNKIVTLFKHNTKSAEGDVDCVWKMTSDNINDAIKKLKDSSFVEQLEKMTSKLNDRPEYIDLVG